jgi:hypothetical protein
MQQRFCGHGSHEEPEHAIAQCESCDEYFCSDHGSKGGDREGGTNVHGNPHGGYAVPSACWKCGGFNADE